MASGLQLGQAVNVLYGVNPVRAADSSAFFRPPQPGVQAADPAFTPVPTTWGFPIVTLHQDAESLLSTLYDYTVQSALGETGTLSVPPGVLALRDADGDDALKAAGLYVGVDLSPGASYMLVRMRRCVATVQHDSVAHFGDKNRDEYLTDTARAAIEGLPTGEPVVAEDVQLPGTLQLDMLLDAAQAAQYVQAFYTYGTHFVSAISAGDVIFQVFVYAPDQFAPLEAAFTNDSDTSGQVTGYDALDYQYYTTPYAAPYGYTSSAGPVVAFSADPALAASIAAGDWQDDRYAGGPSIFEAFSPAHLSEPGGFLARFSQVAPIAVVLSPISDLVADPFRAKTFDRLFKGALLQKYGERVQVPFASLRDYDWNTLFAGTSGSWLSTMATPAIDVYQQLVDLGSVQFANASAVESFTVTSFGLVVSGNQPVAVPGSTVTMVSYILDTSDNSVPPVVTLAPAAMKGLSLSFGLMFGALVFEASDGSNRDVVLDGFRFSTSDPDPVTHRTAVSLVGDVLSPPSPSTLTALTTDLQFSMVSAEALMWSRSAQTEEVRDLTIGYLQWLAGLVPDDCEDEALVAIAAQAMYLARAALNLGGEGVTVPYLTYESYTGYVGSMIQVADGLTDQIRDYQSQIVARKQAELTAKTAEEINDNIKATGQLLSDYFGVLAQNQSDMAGYYQSVLDQKQKDFASNVTNIQRLSQSLADQQKAVNHAVDAFQQAVAGYEAELVAKFIVQVAMDVFSVGVAFAIPSTEITAVKSLGETAQKIQKVINVIAALQKLETDIENTVRTLKGAEQALTQLNGDLDMPSGLEWQEFQVNMTASLAAVPTELAQPKAQLSAAFQILALRGQALLAAQAKQSQLLTDIYFNQRQKAMNDAQAARFTALNHSLHLGDTSPPDVSNIDLVGLTGQVQFQLNQVLAMLAKTLMLQDAAVQYEYLGTPAAMQTFDLSSLKHVMMMEQQSIVNALSNMNPPPLPVDNPIEFRVAGVPTSELTGGAIYQFAIQPSVSEFFKYAMVRVNKVVLAVDGISGSTGGQYLAALSFQGDPFVDRDANRNTITFNTVDRHFGPYLYDIASGAPQFGDQTGSIESSITSITPFGNWQVSLPPTSTNAGMTFAGPIVDIVLTFSITALLVDPPSVLAGRRAGPMLAAATATGTTLAEMLTNMYTDQAVLKGWDVVFNMLEDPVNAILAAQHKTNYGDSQTIDFGFCEGPYHVGSQYIATYTKFNAVLQGPVLQFMQNNSNSVTVTQVITSASIATGSQVVPQTFDPATDCNVDDPNIQWDPPTPIDTSNNPFVQGSVALGQVQGIVAPKVAGSTTQSVVLDFKQSAFTANHLSVTGIDVANFNLQLTNWFVTHEIQYVINTVDYSNISLLPALTPSKFLLNVLTTNSSKNILQLFITTTGTQQNNLTINVNEPIPDGHECSLMINTAIMFNDIFTATFNQGSTNIRVGAISPGNNYQAWSAQVTSGTVNGTVNFDNSGNTQYRINSNGNGISWDLTGLQFLRTEQLALQLSYSKQVSQRFEVRQYNCSSGPYGSFCSWSNWSGHSVIVNVAMSGHYPITLEGAGANQEIQLASTSPDVDVSNTSLQPTGPCECNDHDLQIQVRNELAKDVPGALSQQLAGITFSPISVFALENLLFPAANYIAMAGAYVPGDLVIVGNITAPAAPAPS